MWYCLGGVVEGVRAWFCDLCPHGHGSIGHGHLQLLWVHMLHMLQYFATCSCMGRARHGSLVVHNNT